MDLIKLLFFVEVTNNMIMDDHKPRSHNRYSIKTVARVRKLGTEDWVEVRVISLSPMGASFDNTGYLSPSDTIEFFMPSPTQASPPYHLSARVVWIRDEQVGVEFTGSLRKV